MDHGPWTGVGLRIHDSPCKAAILGKVMPDDTAVSCAKMAEPVEIPFGLRTRVGPRKHVVDGVQIFHAKEQFLGERTRRGPVACPMTLFSEPCKIC